MFGWLRRKTKIADRATLADFIDRQSAFVVQKGIFEYSRARAGHYSKVLFNETGFIQAVDQARWRAFPLGVAMVAEVVDSALRRNAPGMVGVTAAVQDAARDVFARYSVPDVLGADEWRKAREDLGMRLSHLTLHAPKRAFDVSEPYAQTYFDLMPIHEKVRRPDFPTLRNYLRVVLCNIYDEFVTQLDIPALTADLASTNRPGGPAAKASVNASN